MLSWEESSGVMRTRLPVSKVFFWIARSEAEAVACSQRQRCADSSKERCCNTPSERRFHQGFLQECLCTRSAAGVPKYPLRPAGCIPQIPRFCYISGRHRGCSTQRVDQSRKVAVIKPAALFPDLTPKRERCLHPGRTWSAAFLIFTGWLRADDGDCDPADRTN